MTNSLINTIYADISDTTRDDNPFYKQELQDLSDDFLKKYGTQENYSELEFNLSNIAVQTEMHAFTVGFKTAMKFMQEVAL